MIRKILPLLFLLLSSNTILEVQAEVLPIEAFASLPDSSSLSLSPNGEKLVSLTRIAAKGNKGIAVELTTLSSGKKKYYYILIIVNTLFVTLFGKIIKHY